MKGQRRRISSPNRLGHSLQREYDHGFSNRAAFTLLETLIVIVILAVLASVIIPASRSVHTQSLESVSRVVAADLRLARSRAIQFNTEWSVTFDLENNSYELTHTGSGSPPALNDPLAAPDAQDGTYVIDLDRLGGGLNRSGGVRLAGARLKDSQVAVTTVAFGPLGGTGPGRIEDTEIWLSTGVGSDTRTIPITISWVTGQAWIEEPRMIAP